MIYFKTGISIILVAIALCSIVPIALAQDRQISRIQTFSDPESGISFQYPSDWQIASEEYSEYLTEETKKYLLDYGLVDRSIPVVDIVSNSGSDAFLTIVSERLPFPMSVEQYWEANEKMFDILDVKASKIIPISIGNIEGYKFNVTQYDFTQTQIAFTKGSMGYVINYHLGFTELLKDKEALDMMINSLKIE